MSLLMRMPVFFGFEYGYACAYIGLYISNDYVSFDEYDVDL